MIESNQQYHIPHALFNSISMFNPYQYKPFSCVFQNWNPEKNVFEWNKKNLLITDEVGVGKTFEAGIILQEVLKNNHNARILLVCPVKLAQQWQKEMITHFFLGFTIFDAKFHQASHLNQLSIVPYSQLSQVWEKAQFDVLILDEAHYIRNQGATYGYVEQMVAKNASSFKIFMTATPIFNTEDDYDNITGLLESSEANLTEGELGFATTTTLQGEANLYNYQMKITNHSVSLKEGTESSLMKTVMTGDFGFLTGFLKRISTSSLHSLGVFLENRQNRIEETQKINSDPKTLGKALKTLNEVHGEESYVDWMLEGEETTFSPHEKALLETCQQWIGEGQDSKFDQLMSLLNEISIPPTENDGYTKGVVLFSCFISTGKYLHDKLNEYFSQNCNEVYVYQISGGMSKLEVQRTIETFSNHCKSSPDKLTILICSDAFKEGQNFQFCQHLIHYDFPYTPAAMGQRNGRIYRTGQVGTPKSYYITVENSYDYRLFGEIIVSKAAIVGEYGKEGKISILNVLPGDDETFLRACLENYFLSEFQVVKSVKNYVYRLLHKLLCPENVRKILRQEDMDAIKNRLPPTIQEELHKDNQEGYLKGLLLFFLEVSEDKKLLDTYENKYKQQLQHINHLFFGTEEDNMTQLNVTKTTFVNHCETYLESKQIEHPIFCHHLYVDKKVTFPEYSKQFKALYLLEKEVPKNGRSETSV